MREIKERETLATSLRRFMPVTTPRCGAVGGIGTPVSRLYTLTLAYGLKKYTVFIRVFSVFPLFSPFFLDFPTKSAVFSRFISVSGNRGIYVF
jgi:hypothetical protein